MDKARWGRDHAVVRETWQPVIHVPASSSRTAQGERPGSASATDKRAGTRSRDSSFLPSTQNNSRAFDPEMHITLNSRTRDALSLPTPRFLRYRKEGCPTRISPSLFHRLPSHPPSRRRSRLSRLFTLEFSSCRSPSLPPQDWPPTLIRLCWPPSLANLRAPPYVTAGPCVELTLHQPVDLSTRRSGLPCASWPREAQL